MSVLEIPRNDSQNHGTKLKSWSEKINIKRCCSPEFSKGEAIKTNSNKFTDGECLMYLTHVL